MKMFSIHNTTHTNSRPLRVLCINVHGAVNVSGTQIDFNNCNGIDVENIGTNETFIYYYSNFSRDKKR